jgi:hypothetical protein
MTRPKDELRAIEDALIQSIMDASPEDTMAELREQGLDPDACVTLMDKMAAEAVVAARRERLAAAKARAAVLNSIEGGKIDEGDRAAARQMLANLRAGHGNAPMMLAARKGIGSSERDDESLADDLAELQRLRREDGEP